MAAIALSCSLDKGCMISKYVKGPCPRAFGAAGRTYPLTYFPIIRFKNAHFAENRIFFENHVKNIAFHGR